MPPKYFLCSMKEGTLLVNGLVCFLGIPPQRHTQQRWTILSILSQYRETPRSQYRYQFFTFGGLSHSIDINFSHPWVSVSISIFLHLPFYYQSRYKFQYSMWEKSQYHETLGSQSQYISKSVTFKSQSQYHYRNY